MEQTDGIKIEKMKALLAEGFSFSLVVTGCSMLPLLHPLKNTVTVSPVTGKIRRGDILFYTCGGETVRLHRVHKVTEERLYLVGDAQVRLEPVAYSQVLGRVTDYRNEKGRIIPATDLWYRIKVFFWQLTRPLRPWLMKLMTEFSKKTAKKQEQAN